MNDKDTKRKTTRGESPGLYGSSYVMQHPTKWAGHLTQSCISPNVNILPQKLKWVIHFKPLLDAKRIALAHISNDTNLKYLQRSITWKRMKNPTRFWYFNPTVTKSTIFWDITPCSPLKVNRRFRETHRFHLQGRISRARYQRESRWQATCSYETLVVFSGLHGAISLKITLFITTGVKTSNPTVVTSFYQCKL
jgi:hypothetical protein